MSDNKIHAFDTSTHQNVTGTPLPGNKRALDVTPINTVLTPTFVTLVDDKKLFSVYDEVVAVVNGVTTTVITHTFDAVKASKLYSVSASGENIALYELFIDSVLIEKQRTYFGGNLDVEFNFQYGLDVGLSSVIELKAVHTRPNNGSFNATLKYLEGL